MKKLTRRKFVKNTILASAAIPLASNIVTGKKSLDIATRQVPLHWLDGAPKNFNGTTWGVPWPKGSVKKKTEFTFSNGQNELAIQSWPLAYWPDGTLKWTAHALPPQENLAENAYVKIGKGGKSPISLAVKEDKESIRIDTGKIQCQLSKSGNSLIHSLSGSGTTDVANGKLVLWTQDKPGNDPGDAVTSTWFEGKTDKVSIEQSGPIRAVIKIEGSHVDAKKNSLLPFVVRLYFYAGSDAIRIMHTIIYDGDENKAFIRGLGIRFNINLKDTELHNRHIRFVGQDDGVFAEAVRGLTGLRRDPARTLHEINLRDKRRQKIDCYRKLFRSAFNISPYSVTTLCINPHPMPSKYVKEPKPDTPGCSQDMENALRGQPISAHQRVGLHLASEISGKVTQPSLIYATPIPTKARSHYGCGHLNPNLWISDFIMTVWVRIRLPNNWKVWRSLMKIMSRSSGVRLE